MTTITPIKRPFAYDRNDNTLPNYTASTPDKVANQQTGFPILQAEDLSNPDATPVKEEEMNGVLNYYTDQIYQLGKGGVYTFNPDLVAASGGYPLGAILWCDSNNTFQRSLVANNTANFIATPTYINDGVNWIQQGQTRGAITRIFSNDGINVTTVCVPTDSPIPGRWACNVTGTYKGLSGGEITLGLGLFGITAIGTSAGLAVVYSGSTNPRCSVVQHSAYNELLFSPEDTSITPKDISFSINVIATNVSIT